MPLNSASDMVSMAAIGEKLKAAREKRGLTIDQVQKQTHIYSTVLTALEEGRCDELLTSTYVRSFLKKYSNYLGLDARNVMDEYHTVHPEPVQQNMPRRTEEKKAADYLRYLYIVKPIAILLSATLLIFILGNTVANYLRTHKPKAAPPASAKNKSVKSAFASGQGDMMLFREPIPKGSPISLSVKVKQHVLVQFKKDGAILYKRVLPKGSAETLKADEVINIYVAKAEALDLSVNNKRLKLDVNGAIKDLEITRKGVRIK